jgi:hypothetical protein
MKTILLWGPRFPDQSPVRLTVADEIASAAVRAKVAAAADATQAGALAQGEALSSDNPVEVVLQHGAANERTRRVVLPTAVATVAAGLGLAAAVGGPSLGGGGAPIPSTLRAPYRDDFTTAAGPLGNRAIAGRVSYASITESNPDANTTDNPFVVTSGKGYVAGRGSLSKNHAYRVPETSRDYFLARITALTNPLLEFHIQPATADGSFNGIRFGATATGFFISTVVNGSSTSSNNLNLTTDTPRIGDIIECRTGDDDYFEFRLNGLLVGDRAGYTLGRAPLASAGFVPTGFHGLTGNAPATGSVDFIEGSNPAIVSRMIAILPARVLPLEADGTAVWRFPIEYTGAAPTALKYRVWTVATGNANPDTVKAGFDGVPLTQFTVDTAKKLVNVQVPIGTPVSLTQQYYMDIWREDAVDAAGNPAVIMASTPYVMHSPVGAIVTLGQSLNVGMDTSGNGTSAAASTNGWVINVNSNKPTWGVSKTLPAAGTGNAAYFQLVAPAFNSGPLNMVAGGIGATSSATRGVGSIYHDQVRQGLAWVGNRISHVLVCDGQTDENSTPAAYALPYFGSDGVLPDLVAVNGGVQMPVLFTPLGVHQGGGSAPTASLNILTERMRRFQAFELPNTYSWVVPGPFYLDLQHANNDDWHLTAANYGELRRRQGFCMANRLAPGSNPSAFRGPSLVSAARATARTIAVTVALNGFDGLEIINTSVTANKTDVFNAGLEFATAVGTQTDLIDSSGALITTLAGTFLTPTGVSVGAPAGGQVVVTYTFAADLPATVYVRGPWGASPFNKGGSRTVDNDLLNQATIMRGTLSNDATLRVAVQPFYKADRNDYLVAA